MDSSPERYSPTTGTMPPVICANLREKILPEEIPAIEITKIRKDKSRADVLEPVTAIPIPVPSHPLTIAWSPQELLFEIHDEATVQRLWIWNSCLRSIFIHCCELWDETAYLGAQWRCYWMPGLMAELFLRASPKAVSPIPCAKANLQLAAAHKRDHVTGFFAVPVNVKFLNHIPYLGEGFEG